MTNIERMLPLARACRFKRSPRQIRTAVIAAAGAGEKPQSYDFSLTSNPARPCGIRAFWVLPGNRYLAQNLILALVSEEGKHQNQTQSVPQGQLVDLTIRCNAPLCRGTSYSSGSQCPLAIQAFGTRVPSSNAAEEIMSQRNRQS